MKKVCGMIRLARISAFLIIVLTLLSTLASPIYVQGALKVKVTGRVVDENGQGLKNVKIKAYSSEEGYETYIKSTSTLSDGSFAIDLTVGKEYILRFSKEGYTKEKRSIPIRMYGTGKISLGDIVLLKVLRLSSPILSRVANPGDKLAFPFTISNIGEKTMTVDLLVMKPDGWTAKIFDQISEVRRVSLSSGGSLSLNLEVTIPKDALGTYNLTLMATSNKISSSLNFTITVEPPKHPHYELELWTATPIRIAKAGSSVDFNVEIKNLGAEEAILNLTLEGFPKGWKGHFFYGEGEIACLALKSGDSATIRINMEIPKSAEEGDYSFNFTVNTGDFKRGIELKVIVEPIEIERGIRLACRYPSLTIKAGDTAAYEIKVTNEGGGEEHIYFSTNFTSPDLYIEFSAREVEIAAGESLSLSVTVVTRRRIAPGEYVIPIIAETEDKQLSDNITLKLQVKGDYKMAQLRLSSPILSRVANPGDKLTFPFTVHNIGERQMTVDLLVTKPEGWTARILDQISEVRRVSLPGGGSLSLNLEVTIPKDALGTYNLTLTAKSDNGISESLNLTVTIKPPEHPRRKIELWTATPALTAKAGSSVDFNVEIKNLGAEEAILNLTLEGLPRGWRAHLLHGKEEIDSLALKSGDSATIRINIEIPKSAEEGEYSFNLTANTGGFSKGIKLEVEVEPFEIERGIRLMCRYPSLTIKAGDAATYDLIVTNKGDEDEHVYFSTNFTSPDLDIEFSAKEVEVPAGESLSLSITASTHRGIMPGEYVIPIIAETEDKQLSDNITLRLCVKGAYRLTLRLMPLNVRVTAGGECEAIASVHNEGQSTITNVKLEFDAPSGWTVISKPENILRLEPGRSVDFTVTVEPPSDALAADYYVTVTAASDQTRSISRDLRVTVEVPTGWGYLGVIAIAIIILTVAGIFLKIRRK